ncbi:hypothetical protein MN116_005004 [Schistosoma mekongi]|uniref:Uncharacterized protein n=1 Tax=Schistosoma mekongi TaxID=38744 RepID=A0AAE1ZDS0_SCHME|nr:hypothetical protein MN116_005004 [Schistosoma mekongi]
MDSKLNCKEHSNYEFVENEHASCLAKMPTATAQQLTIAKILSRPDSDVNIRCYVVQLQELTKCSEDQAITALYDCENNIERAVELVLDTFRGGATEEWHTTVSKRGKTKHSQSVPDPGPEIEASQKKSVKPKPEKPVENQDKLLGQNGPSPAVSITKSSNLHPEKSKKPSTKKKNIPRTDGVAVERVCLPPQSRSNDLLYNNLKPLERKNRLESEVWDPYADCSEWEGDSIEIVNSNASIAMGLQEVVSLPPELFHDNSHSSEKNSNTECDSNIDAIQNLTKDPDSLDAESLFVSAARSKRPPRAFTGNPNVSLFFAPELLPNEKFSWKPTFGCDLHAHKSNPNASAVTISGKIADSTDETLRAQNDSRSSRASKDPTDCNPDQFSYPQISQQQHSSDFELKSASLGALLEPTNKTDGKVSSIANDYPTRHYDEQIMSKVPLSYPISHNKQSSMVPRPSSDKPNYLEPSLKSYLLDGVTDNINKLNVGETSGQSTKDQFSIQNNSQSSLNSFPHSQNDQHMIHPQVNKIPASQSTTHVSGHAQPVNNNAQATHLPQGMPHFISQFAPPAYHMFNLPGGSNTAPAIFDLDHLQLLQQQRMLYDMHLQHHAATTAQSLLTANPDSSAAGKPVSHNLPNPLSHVTAANTGMRPDMLTTALGHTPQMMTPGHPYFPYPSFVLMNGYPNPFLNQQPNSDNSEVQNPGQCASPITQHQPQMNQTQSYNSLKQLASGVGNYEDLLDVKYGDPSKQVGFKANSNPPNYGSFQSQAMSLDTVSGKLSSVSHSNGSLVQNFSHGNSNSHAQHFPPQFYASVSGSPYMNTVAAAVAAAAAKHGSSNSSAVSTNQSNSNVGVAPNQAGSVAGQNPMHLPGNPSQAMVLGNAGQSLHHHQRAPIPHPQH